ncbi:DUF4232 domain-containing protein [Streptantibioticus rubrisoli]|uniref:DUF4232 domain-containing protein n=1 Tax=Streptantibioticus rubrisoli TaxID=1387313 RepID=A0ABT1PBG2_9ACTN|nr:DUF4232 domain-containing protein [Streptantibioticus rubrisoli]MCQ4042719.1 DUF4232 domain-containing protein [Streptantibioticus rubrisoli]
MRHLLSAAAVAGAAALVGGLGTGVANAADAHTAAARPAACQPGSLRVVLDSAGQEQVGMSHAGTFLRVTNTGKTTCTFSGYPGLALEGSGHTALKTTVRRGATYFAQDPGIHPVTLKRGASAWADLVWTHTGAHTAHAKYLQISPTGSNAHSTVAFNQDVDNGTLAVTAWSAKAPRLG